MSAQSPAPTPNEGLVEVTDLLERFESKRFPYQPPIRLGAIEYLRDEMFRGRVPTHAVLRARQVFHAEADRQFGFGSEDTPVRTLRAPSLIAQIEDLLEVDIDHEEIAEGPRQFVRSTDAQGTQRAVDWIRSSLPPTFRLEFEWTRTSNTGSQLLLRDTVRLQDGTATLLGDVRTRQAVTDLHVEIAQAASITNPRTTTVRTGATIGIRPRWLPLTGEVLLETFAQRIAPLSGETIEFHRSIGPIERAANRFEQAGTLIRLGRGEQSIQAWTATDGSQHRIEVRADWTERPPTDPNGPTLVSGAILGQKILGFRADRDLASGPELSISNIFSELERETDGGSAFELLEGPGLLPVMVAQPGLNENVITALRGRVDRSLTPVQITAEIFDAPIEAEVDASGSAPAGARRLGSFSGSTLLGLPLCFTSGREQTYVADFQVEVAQSSRLVAPEVGLVEDGWFANVTVHPGFGDRPRRVELSFESVLLEELRRRQLTLNQRTLTATQSEEFVMPADVVHIELPHLRSTSVMDTVPLGEDGTAVISRSASELLGEGRQLVVRLKID